MTTSRETKWREARMAIKAARDLMALPEGKTCANCANIEHCKWLFSLSGNETECNIFPSRYSEMQP